MSVTRNRYYWQVWEYINNDDGQCICKCVDETVAQMFAEYMRERMAPEGGFTFAVWHEKDKH